jgi:2-dehydropantoate 2-reductase
MRFLIAGAGAVGGYLAARLADGGQDVTVLARPARAARLRQDGLALTRVEGSRVYRLVVVTADQVGAPCDAVVLAVKAEALAQVMADIAPAVGPATVVVPFLNGMGHIDRLRQRFGSAVIGGVLRIVTQLDDTGSVRVLAPMFEVELGGFDEAAGPGLEATAAAFRGAGADVTIQPDITGALWAKWVFIASIGAITSLMRAPVGDVVAVPGGAEFARSIVAEAAAVAEAAGHRLPAGSRQALEDLVTTPGSAMTSSLSRDLAAGRHTEADAVIGDLVARGQALGIGPPGLGLTALALRVHNRRLGG